MIYVYFVLSVVSSAAFAADMILRYMEKIKSFDYEKRLFNLKSGIIPAEKFLPENLTMLIVVVMTASVSGAIYTVMGMNWCLSLFCAVAGGMTVCFLIQHIGRNAVDSAKGRKLPKGEAAAGLDGYCVNAVAAGDWGLAVLFYNDREYKVRVAVLGEGDVSGDEKITALYESGGIYFAVRSDKVYKEVE